MVFPKLALGGIYDSLHIHKKLNLLMKRLEIQMCNRCGKEFHEWSCDYCYAKIIISQSEDLVYSK